MKYSDLKSAIISQFNRTALIPYLLLGKPGGGKTALAKDVAKEMNFENVLLFNASLRDVTDLLGTPRNDGVITEWKPPKELYQLREGRWLLILDEMTDSGMMMQNGLCGLSYERRLNDLVLSPEVYIIATGNRPEDKSGAQRLNTKLAGRYRVHTFDTDLDDFCAWGLLNGIDPIIIQFVRFRPFALHDFDPSRTVNSSPRAWARVSQIDPSLPEPIYQAEVAGDVGEGIASEYVSFRHIHTRLPNIDGIIMNPSKSEVPTELSVLFALTGALAQRVSKDNFDRVYEYAQKLPPDFRTMLVSDAYKLRPEIKSTKAFVKFAVENQNLMF